MNHDWVSSELELVTGSEGFCLMFILKVMDLVTKIMILSKISESTSCKSQKHIFNIKMLFLKLS